MFNDRYESTAYRYKREIPIFWCRVPIYFVFFFVIIHIISMSILFFERIEIMEIIYGSTSLIFVNWPSFWLSRYLKRKNIHDESHMKSHIYAICGSVFGIGMLSAYVGYANWDLLNYIAQDNYEGTTGIHLGILSISLTVSPMMTAFGYGLGFSIPGAFRKRTSKPQSD